MINTINIKQQQLSKGFFTVGSGPEVMLIMGSCRVAPYVNYLALWNTLHGNRFTIHSIDPFNWNWDEKDNRVDYAQVLQALESDTRILGMLTSVKIFIHEFYDNAGMFNVSRHNNKNIYGFGMKPELDITIPNFNDVFILTREIVTFDADIRRMAIQDYNVIGRLSDQTLHEIRVLRQKNIEKFCWICNQTDFPEFATRFVEFLRSKRYFWTFNHVSKHFTLEVFDLMNEKFLKLPLTPAFWEQISQQDLFANNYTKVCEYDEGFEWGEPVEKLKLP